jgi:hypothetical protein
VHAPSEEKSDDSEDIICKELEHVFIHFPKYHIKILLGDFNAKLWRDVIFKPTIGNEGLRQDIKDGGVRTVNLAISKNLVLKSMMFPRRNIRKYTWTSPDGISSVFDVRSFRGAKCDTDHYLVVAKVRERLAVSKQEHRILMWKKFKHRKLSEQEVKKQYQIRI